MKKATQGITIFYTLKRGFKPSVKWFQTECHFNIHMKDTIAGGTVYWLNTKVDGGPIAAQAHCFVRPGDTPYELWVRDLQPLGVALLNKVLKDIQNGLIVAISQDEALASWEPSVGRAPLFRPDLPLIGPAPDGFRVLVTRSAL